jgi:hypothetical protein
VAKAKPVHGAHKEIGRVTQAKCFQPPRQLPCTFLTVGDAGDTARRPDIFGKDPRQLQHQRLGLAAPWPRKDNAMAARVVGSLLTRVADQIADMPLIGDAKQIPFG